MAASGLASVATAPPFLRGCLWCVPLVSGAASGVASASGVWLFLVLMASDSGVAASAVAPTSGVAAPEKDSAYVEISEVAIIATQIQPCC